MVEMVICMHLREFWKRIYQQKVFNNIIGKLQLLAQIIWMKEHAILCDDDGCSSFEERLYSLSML